jgi:hypothetical protein
VRRRGDLELEAAERERKGDHRLPDYHPFRRHERRPLPRLSWQYSAKRRQQRPVSWRRRGASDLPLEHAQLMPQEQDLDLLRPVRAEAQHDKLKQPLQRPVRKR